MNSPVASNLDDAMASLLAAATYPISVDNAEAAAIRELARQAYAFFSIRRVDPTTDPQP